MPTPRKEVMIANREKMLIAVEIVGLHPIIANTSDTDPMATPGGSDPRIRTSQARYIAKGIDVPENHTRHTTIRFIQRFRLANWSSITKIHALGCIVNHCEVRRNTAAHQLGVPCGLHGQIPGI